MIFLTTIQLNDRVIPVTSYQEDMKNDRLHVAFTFNVTSAEYHELAVLLYEQTFRVTVPHNARQFTGTIVHYVTDTTNLYEANQVANYAVTLAEVKE